MKKFLGDNFLLPDRSSRRLFHDYAEDMPIVDYHCHLSPADIASDARFSSIAQAWLGGDHYKWRAMRANGVPESDITGHPADKRTFLAWARTLPSLVGNPLYYWTHLELRRYFGIEEILCERSAERIWEECNEMIAGPDFGARALLRRMRVVAVCTTDDPADGLEHHEAYAKYRASSMALRDSSRVRDGSRVRDSSRVDEPLMVPAFRPDKALAIENLETWREYLPRLAAAAMMDIRSYADLVEALDKRHAFFDENGCRLSDHALVQVPAKPISDGRAEELFLRAISPPCRELSRRECALARRVGGAQDRPSPRGRPDERKARLDDAAPPRVDAQPQLADARRPRPRHRL